MLRRCWWVLLLGLLSCASSAGRSVLIVQPGQSKTDAVAALGQPLALLSVRGREFQRYPSGILVYERDAVVERWAKPRQIYSYSGQVSAISSGQSGKRVRIVSGMPGVSAGDLQYREAEAFLRIVLEERGFVVVDDDGPVDLYLGMNYGISDPNVEISHVQVPITVHDPGERYTATVKDEDGNETKEVVVEREAQTRVVGYRTVEQRRVSFRRHLILRALEAAALQDGRELELWKVMSFSVGPTDDFRMILPALFAGAWQWIAADTMGQKAYQLDDADLRIFALRFLKSEAPSSPIRAGSSAEASAPAPAEVEGAGTAVGKPCRRDGRCDPGLACASGQCEPAGFNGQMCHPDGSCETGLSCVDGRCRAGDAPQ